MTHKAKRKPFGRKKSRPSSGKRGGSRGGKKPPRSKAKKY